MNINRRGGDARMHDEISALIPWYVNGSIGEGDRQRVDAHLTQCARCREDMALERRVYAGMSVEPGVEYMPAASLKRLQSRLDDLTAASPGEAGAEAPRTPLAAAGRRAVAPQPRAVTWHGVMAASVAIMAVAVSMLAADRWMQSRAPADAPYRTVTISKPRAPNEVIRAVFVPTITLVELQAVLDEAGLRIVSGPTEAGVYSLAANSRRPVSASLASLRGHAKVRFAESIQPSVGPGDTP
jgi:anti-sigma factor RsiW